MKKIKIFSAALILSLSVGLLTSSCSSNDPIETPDPQLSIVGKWREAKSEVYLNGNLINTINTSFNSNCPDYSEFKADGTYVDIEKDANCVVTFSETGTYTYNSSTKVLTNTTPGQPAETVQLYDLTANSYTTEFTEIDNGSTYKTKVFWVKIN